MSPILTLQKSTYNRRPRIQQSFSVLTNIVTSADRHPKINLNYHSTRDIIYPPTLFLSGTLCNPNNAPILYHCHYDRYPPYSAKSQYLMVCAYSDVRLPPQFWSHSDPAVALHTSATTLTVASTFPDPRSQKSSQHARGISFPPIPFPLLQKVALDRDAGIMMHNHWRYMYIVTLHASRKPICAEERLSVLDKSSDTSSTPVQHCFASSVVYASIRSRSHCSIKLIDFARL